MSNGKMRNEKWKIVLSSASAVRSCFLLLLPAPAVCHLPSALAPAVWPLRSLIVQALFENEGFGAGQPEIPPKLLWERPLLLIGHRAMMIPLFNLARTRQKTK
jgi:hypothetical protein